MCNFDMKFTFVYAGWEGSANDAEVLRDAIKKYPKFSHPPPPPRRTRTTLLILIMIMSLAFLHRIADIGLV